MTQGPAISGSQIVSAMLATIQTNYKAVRTALGLAHLGDIQTFDTAANERSFTSGSLPGVVVTTSGTASAPVRTEPGVYTIEFDVFIYLFDRGASFGDVATKIADWCALLRSTILAYPSLGGLSASTRFEGETYDDIPTQNVSRSLGGGGLHFTVTVEHAVDGPAVLALVAPGTPVGAIGLTITSQE